MTAETGCSVGESVSGAGSLVIMNVLDYSLPYESTPATDRRIDFDAKVEDGGVVVIAHCVRDGELHKITLCSGFALEGPGHRDGETLAVTCAHTLEEASRLFIFDGEFR